MEWSSAATAANHPSANMYQLNFDLEDVTQDDIAASQTDSGKREGEEIVVAKKSTRRELTNSSHLGSDDDVEVNVEMTDSTATIVGEDDVNGSPRPEHLSAETENNNDKRHG